MQAGNRAVFKGDGQVGRIVEVLNGGTLAVFESKSGARFTARADELEAWRAGEYPVRAAAASREGIARWRAQARRTFVEDAGRTLYRLDHPARQKSGAVRGRRRAPHHDPEEEHDCFSDNTHASHFFDALGMRNVYFGTYRRIDRSLVSGPSISDLVRVKAPEVDAEVRAKLDATMEAMNALYVRALTTESYDQMIGEGNAAGNEVVERVITALLDQTKAIERAVAALDLKAIAFEGSDSLGDPAKVQVENKAEATP